MRRSSTAPTLPPTLLLLVVLLAAAPPGAERAAWAADPGFVTRSAELRARPAFNAPALARLAPGSQVSLLQRRGGWQEVAVSGASTRGWIRHYQVRPGQAPAGTVQSGRDDDRGVLSNLAAFSRSAAGLVGNRPASGSQTTATLGIRGLSADELAAAKPDPGQLATLKKHAVDRAAGRSFAAQARLKKQKVDYLKGGP